MTGPRLEVTSLWFPTRISGERQAPMGYEYAVNVGPENGEVPSMAEIVWATGDIDQAMARLPAVVPSSMRRIARHLLQPWPEGRYTEAYHRTGGILNLFTPSWGEPEDIVWQALLSRWQATDYADADERQNAFRALGQEWNITPHPFFAGLTPAQVMVGGGLQESELARAFLKELARQLEGQPFPSEGAALVRTLSLLRSWELSPRNDDRSPREIILAERTQLLERRATILHQSK